MNCETLKKKKRFACQKKGNNRCTTQQENACTL